MEVVVLSQLECTGQIVVALVPLIIGEQIDGTQLHHGPHALPVFTLRQRTVDETVGHYGVADERAIGLVAPCVEVLGFGHQLLGRQPFVAGIERRLLHPCSRGKGRRSPKHCN